jgi:hypothetical protein
VIGLLVALLSAPPDPPPQKPRPPRAREDVVVRGELVLDYFPGAGFTARVGMEWSLQ